jgi:hypothetical protein
MKPQNETPNHLFCLSDEHINLFHRLSEKKEPKGCTTELLDKRSLFENETEMKQKLNRNETEIKQKLNRN